MIKKILIPIKIIILYHIIITDIYAASLLSIKKIESNKQFPNIFLEITLEKITNNIIEDIDEDNFILYEDGTKISNIKLVQIHDLKESYYTVISIDTSKSINYDYFNSLKKAAIKIIKKPGGKENFALFSFNDEVKLLNNFTADKELIIKNIQRASRHGKKSILFNSIYDSIELLKQVNIEKKKVLIFTDGRDIGSTLSDNDLIKFANEQKTPIYFVFPKKALENKQISRISTLTGGKIFYLYNDNIINDLNSSLNYPISNRFRINYKSMVKLDGSEHQIDLMFKFGTIKENAMEKFVTSKSVVDLILSMDSRILMIITIFLVLSLLILNIFIFRRKKNQIIQRNSNDNNNLPLIKSSAINIENNTNVPIIENTGYNDSVIEPENEYYYTDAWLIQKEGLDAGKKILIISDEIIIGSGDECGIIINDNSISFKHIKLKKLKGQYYIYDLISEKGTFLNGKKLLRPREIHDWDEIKIGKNCLIFRGTNSKNL